MHSRRPAAERRRAGYLTPALAMALLAAFLVGALVLNMAWRRAADREIAVAADAAALASASALACDERLLDGPLPQTALDRVAARAGELSSRHPIVGVPALPTPDGLRIGKKVIAEDGEPQLIETSYQPSMVAVTVQRGSDGRLPWLFRAGPYTSSRLSATAEASIDGRVAALRPRAGGTVPAWPIALLGEADTAEIAEGESPSAVGWRDQIEMKLGPDRYSYDDASKRVVEHPDGLPELVVLTLPSGGDPDETGMTLVDVGQTFGADRLDVAFRNGLRGEDLTLLDGEVPVGSLAANPETADALPRLPIEAERNLSAGDARAVFLFEQLAGSGGRFTARLTGVVVARLMDLRPTGDGGWQATFQPAVLATGTAVLADAGDGVAPEGRYLYKVRLTR